MKNVLEDVSQAQRELRILRKLRGLKQLRKFANSPRSESNPVRGSQRELQISRKSRELR